MIVHKKTIHLMTDKFQLLQVTLGLSTRDFDILKEALKGLNNTNVKLFNNLLYRKIE